MTFYFKNTSDDRARIRYKDQIRLVLSHKTTDLTFQPSEDDTNLKVKWEFG